MYLLNRNQRFGLYTCNVYQPFCIICIKIFILLYFSLYLQQNHSFPKKKILGKNGPFVKNIDARNFWRNYDYTSSSIFFCRVPFLSLKKKNYYYYILCRWPQLFYDEVCFSEKKVLSSNMVGRHSCYFRNFCFLSHHLHVYNFSLAKQGFIFLLNICTIISWNYHNH